ncbi:uncharacterized protein LOC120330321 isoform X2 [Styela clava]
MKVLTLAIGILCMSFAYADLHGNPPEGGRGADDESGKLMEFMTDLLGMLPKGSGTGDTAKIMDFVKQLFDSDKKGGEDGERDDSSWKGGDTVSKLAMGIFSGILKGQGVGESGFGGGDWDPVATANSIKDLISGTFKTVFEKYIPSKNFDIEKNSEKFTIATMDILDGLFPGWRKQDGYSRGVDIDVIKLLESIEGDQRITVITFIENYMGNKASGNTIVEFMKTLLGVSKTDGKWVTEKEDWISKLTMGVTRGMIKDWQAKDGKDGVGLSWNATASANSVRNAVNGIFKEVFPDWDESTDQPSGFGVFWNPEGNSEKFTRATMDILDKLFPQWRERMRYGKGLSSSAKDGIGSDLGDGRVAVITFVEDFLEGDAGGSDKIVEFAKVLLGVSKKDGMWKAVRTLDTVSKLTLGIIKGMVSDWQEKDEETGIPMFSFGQGSWDPIASANTVRTLVNMVMKSVFPDWDEGQSRPGTLGMAFDIEKNAEQFTEASMDVLDGMLPNWRKRIDYGKGLSVDVVDLVDGDDGDQRVAAIKFVNDFLGFKAGGSKKIVEFTKTLLGVRRKSGKWRVESRSDVISRFTMGIIRGMVKDWQDKDGLVGVGLNWDHKASATTIAKLINDVMSSTFSTWDTVTDAPDGYESFWDPEGNSEKFTRACMDILDDVLPGWREKHRYGKSLGGLAFDSYGGDLGEGRIDTIVFVENFLGSDAGGSDKIVEFLKMLLGVEKIDGTWRTTGPMTTVSKLTLGITRGMIQDWLDKDEDVSDWPTVSFAEGEWNPIETAASIRNLFSGIVKGAFPEYIPDFDIEKNSEKFTKVSMDVMDGLAPGWRRRLSYGSGLKFEVTQLLGVGDGDHRAAVVTLISDYLGNNKIVDFMKTLLGVKRSGGKWVTAREPDIISKFTMGTTKGLITDWQEKDGKNAGNDWDPTASAKSIRETVNGVLRGAFPDWDSTRDRPDVAGINWDPVANSKKFTKACMDIMDETFPKWRQRVRYGKDLDAGAKKSIGDGRVDVIQFLDNYMGGNVVEFGKALLGVRKVGGKWMAAKSSDTVSKLTLGITSAMVEDWQEKDDSVSDGSGKGDWDPEETGRSVRNLITETLRGVFPDWNEEKDEPDIPGVKWNPEGNSEKFTKLSMDILDVMFPGWRGRSGYDLSGTLGKDSDEMSLIKNLLAGSGDNKLGRFLKALFGDGQYDTVAKLTTGISRGMIKDWKEKDGQEGVGDNWDPEMTAKSITNLFDGVLKGVFPKWDESQDRPDVPGINWDPATNSEKFTKASMDILNALFPDWLENFLRGKLGRDDKRTETMKLIIDILGTGSEMKQLTDFMATLFGVGTEDGKWKPEGRQDTVSKLALGITRGMIKDWKNGGTGDSAGDWNPKESANALKKLVTGVLRGVFPNWDEKEDRPDIPGINWDPEKNSEKFTIASMKFLDSILPGWRKRFGYGEGMGQQGMGMFGLTQWNPRKNAATVTEMTMGVLEGLFPGWQSKSPKPGYAGGYGVGKGMSGFGQSKQNLGGYSGGYSSKGPSEFGGIQWNPAKNAQTVTEITMGVLEGLLPEWQSKRKMGEYSGGYSSKGARGFGMSYDGSKGGFEDWMKGRGWAQGSGDELGTFTKIMSSVTDFLKGMFGGWPTYN